MNETKSSPPAERPTRKRRSDGERSRNAILDEAGRLATIEGLGGLSIGRLADEVGISKSGVFAHFGSKKELQLATIEKATGVFNEQVIEPASRAATGIERLRRLAGNFADYVERSVYPGGCFFASVASEMATHSGPVRDNAVQVTVDFLAGLEAAIRDAQAEGAIDPAEDAEQMAFEIDSYLFLANAQFVIGGDKAPIDRARRAIDERIAAAANAE